jgi:CheY-like chemotaxis protein
LSDSQVWLVGELPEGLSADDVASCVRVDNVREATRRLARADLSPALIVLAQTRPGQLDEQSIAALYRSAPLARFERLVGTWCEGEMRSDPPPAGCTRNYWHLWCSPAANQLKQADNARCRAWELPPTATPDERTLARAAEAVPRGAGRIAVWCASPEMGEVLSDVCRVGGYTTVLVRDTNLSDAVGADAIVWDTTVEAMIDRGRIETACNAIGSVPLVAIAGFPRADDVRAARQAGVTAVLAKPFLMHDLLRQLGELNPST